MKRLLLFDIDGTLTRSRNGHVPFNEAIFETFGVAGDIRSVVADGNTDPLIVTEIFSKSDISVAEIGDRWQDFSTRLRDCYVRALASGKTSLRALPGAAELLDELAAGGRFCSSVVTGNFEVMAQMKLAAAGLSSYVCRGAYGSDSPRRADLPAIARQRCEAALGRPALLEDCIVIGDTPRDLEAARHNRMKCVLVGTGRYAPDELQGLRPDACLPDLTDTAAVLRILSEI